MRGSEIVAESVFWPKTGPYPTVSRVIDTAEILGIFPRSWDGSQASPGPFWGPGDPVSRLRGGGDPQGVRVGGGRALSIDLP